MYLDKNILVEISWSGKIEDLGYDPKPQEHSWRRTPIPRVFNPLPGTPILVEIADRSWCRGAPWTILRNRYEFIINATDNTTDEQANTLWRIIPRINWIEALRLARPGDMSWLSWRFWTFRCQLENPRLVFRRDPEWENKHHFIDQVMAQPSPWDITRKKLEQEEWKPLRN